ncbi:MAG TPA: LamG-like jellyroll fold domain-containing protein [Chitinophagaceae bacterium]|nr:LamG-like jellyroll fold domain-containing protein [Chitinophagaceae bacterium]
MNFARILICVIVFLLAAGRAVSQVNLSQGLIAYYPFDGNANDVSGNNNNPVFNNATLTTDRFGNANKAYYFNGIDNYMRIPNSSSLNPGGQVSLAVWIKPQGYYQGACHGNSVLIKGEDYQSGTYMLRYDDALYTNGNNCRNSTVDTAHTNFYTNFADPQGGYDPYIVTNQWFSVVTTYNGDTGRLYVNCHLVATTVSPGITFNNTADLFIGTLNNPSFPYWLNASLDDIRIYNRALNQDEITALGSCQAQTPAIPSFTIPDTVCVNSPVNITNTSTGASSYYWNFCTADVNHDPTGTNLGNIGNVFSTPVFTDIVSDNGKYYAFVTSYSSGTLSRLDFGNSMLNTPTATNLGSFGGVLPSASTEGVQVIKNEGKWYAIIVGGGTEAGTQPKIVKVSFGSSIENNNPAVTDWGNLNGTLDFPHDLQVFQDNGNWYGFTINKGGNTITRFDFTSSFENSPTATNLVIPPGSNLNLPTGFFVINDNNNWHMFIVNSYDEGFTPPDNGTITRLDFGSSLLNNNPAAINITNSQLGYLMHNPRDISVIRFCSEAIGFVVNHATNDIVKLDFHGDLTSIPTATSLGNIGNLSFPHSISKLFRIGADIYSFIPNAVTSTLTRIKFSGCTNASVPNSTDKSPAAVKYTTPGVYNINLTVDDGLPTQNSLCKQVVVVSGPQIKLTGETTICSGDSAHLSATGAVNYSWLPSQGIDNPNSDSIAVKPAITTKYFVTAKNANGCISKDSIVVNVNTCVNANIGFTVPDTVCVNSPVKIVNTTTGASSYFWSFCTADINQPPVGSNLGNPDGLFKLPVYIDYVFEKGNYYGFATNNFPGRLLRLDFGNSLLNTPVVTNLGTINGAIPSNTEGVQIVNNQGKWYVLVVGGDAADGSTPSLVTVSLGANIANNNPSAVNWGNIGNLSYPHDLYVFQDNAHWYGITANYSNSTITRFDFGTSFDTPPGALNLGNIGQLKGPTGLHALKDNNNKWHVFVTNALSNTLTRLDFDNSLLNNPTGVNLGNPNGTFSTCWDIYVIKYCGSSVAYVINATGNTLSKLDFNGDITNTPSAVNFGNIGDLHFPHCLSKLFRVGSNVYSFITNVNNNTLTRLQFEGCTNANTPNSNKQTPPAVTYSAPGVYNINLTIDDSLPTQNSLCKQVVVTDCQVQCSANPDFSFKQDVCNPSLVQFTNETQQTSSVSWDFGNGQKAGNDLAPSVTYNTYGTYKVTLIVKTSGGCIDSVTKNIAVNFTRDNIIVNSDTLLCTSTSVQLRALPALTYCWSPSTGLSATDIQNPVATVTKNTTYHLSSQIIGANLIANGDFSQGNAGFSSGYSYASINTTEGQYYIGNNPSAWNRNMTACSDHTGNNSNMMLINGNPQPDLKVWSETITVMPNTNYAFSAWVQPIYGVNPAALQFYINGKTIGNIFNAELPTCNWKQFFVTWNSGDTDKADISIINKNIQVLGNDFALDDISFAAVSIKYDSVNINVDSVAVNIAPDTAICAGTTVQLKASASPNTTYNWAPATTLNNPSVISPIATPVITTTYVINVASAQGCTAKDSVKVTVLPQPTVATIADTVICSGGSVVLSTTVANGNSYSWAPANHLSNPNMQSPVASPLSSTQYIVTVNPGSKCAVRDTVNIAVNPLPAVQAFGDTTLCVGASSEIRAAAQGSVSYNWSPVTGLSNPSVFNPVASPSSSTIYTVSVTDNNNCMADASVTVTVNPQPVFSVNPTSKQICIGDQVTLTAAGGDLYHWYPASTVTSPASPSALVTPLVNTTYNVIITNSVCKITDTVSSIITVQQKPTVTISKSNDLDCVLGSATLKATGGNHYTWTPPTGLDHPNIATPVASPVQTITYYVFVENNGCSVKDSITLNVLVANAENGYKMPSAFTPNSDGNNDCFGLKYWGGVKTLEFEVYNRWGNRIFYTSDPSKCWDGTFKGLPQMPGTYVYQIKATTICGNVYRKGTVVLIR